jgi:hypothetical protein
MEKLKKLLLKKVIFEQQIYKLERQIQEELEKELPDHSIGTWRCNKSPIGKCIYNNEEDPCQDNCIYCGQPDERK